MEKAMRNEKLARHRNVRAPAVASRRIGKKKKKWPRNL
jgi:hypothetical protein